MVVVVNINLKVLYLKNNFCTLFDSNFLVYGLALYESLKKNCQEFHLYVFAFDDECYNILKRLSLANVTTISLVEFEDEQLLSIKSSRTRGEYCWTCTPSTILYCLNKYNLPICTYLDSDIYFYNDPSILLKEIEDNDVIITEHRYTPKYDRTKDAGVYCVQFMTFRNTSNGLKVLNWWRNECIKWCFARHEDGKFGDQKYLDDWTERFKGVHVLKHLGGGVAPWNIQQYQSRGNRKLITKKSNQIFDLIFYHFHDVKLHKHQLKYINLFNYDKSYKFFNLIYFPYIKHLISLVNKYNIKPYRLRTSYLLILVYILRKQIVKIKNGIFN